MWLTNNIRILISPYSSKGGIKMDQKLIERSVDVLKTLMEYKHKDAREMSKKEQLALGKKIHYVTNKWKKELNSGD